MASDQQPLHKSTGGQGSQLPPEPLPRRKRCSSYHVFKALSLIYIIIFILIGILLTVLSAWILVLILDQDTLSHSVLIPTVIVLVVGIIILATAFLGCVGGACDKLWPLRIFLGIIIVVFVLQVIVGILAYVYREESVEEFAHRISSVIQDYDDYENVRKAVDKVQRKWHCCGIEGADDWKKNAALQGRSCPQGKLCQVPDSCCTTEMEGCGERSVDLGLINSDGCKNSFKTWLESNLDVIGATALAMAILHILGIFVVYMFITKVEDRIRLFKYRKRFYN